MQENTRINKEQNFFGFLNYIKDNSNNDIEYDKICEAISQYCKNKGDNE